jgi:hypothetical protein
MDRFYSLPDDIIHLIYSFDSTYTDYFSNQVLPYLQYYCPLNEKHLLFRAKQMVEWNDEFPNLSMEWYIESHITSIKLVVREINIHLFAKFYVSYVKHKKGISRFVTLSMIEDNLFIYKHEMYQTEMYFVTNVLTLILKHKHNLIVTDSNNEYYYYSLTFEKNVPSIPIFKDQDGLEKIGKIVNRKAYLFLETGQEISNRLYVVYYRPRFPM